MYTYIFIIRMKLVQKIQEEDQKVENKIGAKEKEAKKRKVLQILTYY